MNKKLFSINLVILAIVFLASLSPSNAVLSSKFNFEMDDSGFYQFSARAEAPILWKEGENALFNVSITIENLPKDNISGITIVAINFILKTSREKRSNLLPESDSTFINQNYKNVSETITFTKALNPPSSVDQFIVVVEILAITTGNITQDINNPGSYSFIFPDDGDILVERPQAAALINLYGFPPTSFILAFLIIAFAIGLPMLIPGFVTVAYVIKDWWIKRKKHDRNDTGSDASTDDGTDTGIDAGSGTSTHTALATGTNVGIDTETHVDTGNNSTGTAVLNTENDTASKKLQDGIDSETHSKKEVT